MDHRTFAGAVERIRRRAVVRLVAPTLTEHFGAARLAPELAVAVGQTNHVVRIAQWPLWLTSQERLRRAEWLLGGRNDPSQKRALVSNAQKSTNDVALSDSHRQIRGRADR